MTAALLLDIEEIHALWHEGRSIKEIAEHFGVSDRAIRNRLPKAWLLARRREKGLPTVINLSTRRETIADAKRQLAALPPDTRDFTARLFGDPPPGRSALDRKRAGEPA